MRLTKLFSKTTKTMPAEEPARNAQLLIQAGYIHKEMAGVYAYLPLGKRVLDKICQLVREEMNAIGGQELIMTSLQRPELWQKTDRWSDENVDIWFKSNLKNGSPVGLAWSHEEQITEMMKNYISSYRDLPVAVYQFQTKLRNELRAKSGILRGREFLMKDLYSYSRDDAEHQAFYDQVKASYLKIFERLGLGDSTFFTFASGGAFTKFSHEFQTITPAGEDTIYLDREKKIAINKEVLNDDVINQLGTSRDRLEEVVAAEVGNTFSFGSVKADQLGLRFTDQAGQERPVILGSYGIGITRLMGVMVELFADKKGLVWPDLVAPYHVYLVRVGTAQAVVKTADELYNRLTDIGVEVLYDDRDEHAGSKFADADLLGIPTRLVISDKTFANQMVEVKKRTEEASKELPIDAVIKMLAAS